MHASLDLFAGIFFFVIGACLSILQIKEYKNGVPDRLGFGIGMLIGGFMFICIGINMIVQNM
jgi:hypothetical protein